MGRDHGASPNQQLPENVPSGSEFPDPKKLASAVDFQCATTVVETGERLGVPPPLFFRSISAKS